MAPADGQGRPSYLTIERHWTTSHSHFLFVLWLMTRDLMTEVSFG